MDMKNNNKGFARPLGNDAEKKRESDLLQERGSDGHRSAVHEKKRIELCSRADMETRCAFAEGLPEWSIEPPQVMVRRRRSI